MSQKQIKSLLWNFFSLPLLLIATALLAYGFGWYIDKYFPEPETDLPTLGGGGIFVFYIGCFVMALCVIWWHIRMITEILKFFRQPLIRYINMAILAYPYVIAAIIFLVRYSNEIGYYKKVNRQIIDKEYTVREIANKKDEIIATERGGDSIIVICGETMRSTKPADSLVRIIRGFPKITKKRRADFLYHPAKKSTLKYYVIHGDSIKN